MSTMRKFVNGGGVIYPPLLNHDSNTLDFYYEGLAIDYDNILSIKHDVQHTKMAVIFQCPVSSTYTIGETAPFLGTLDTVECSVLPYTIGDPNPTIKFSFQDLDENDLPDGVADEYRIIEVETSTDPIWIKPGLLTSDGTDNGTKRAVTRGQKLAVVIEFDSSSPLDNFALGVIPVSQEDGWHQAKLMYWDNGDAQAWVDQYNTYWGIACMGIKYSGIPVHEEGNLAVNSWFNMPEMMPVSLIDTGEPLTAFNNASNPDEVGMQFNFPTDVVISGVLFSVNITDALATADIILYDNPTNFMQVLETIPFKFSQNGYNPYRFGYKFVKFKNEHKLNAHDIYRIMIKPTSTAYISLGMMHFDDAEKCGSLWGSTDLAGNFTGWSLDYRYQSGTFQDVNENSTTVPMISFLIYGFEQEGTGGVGGDLGDL